MIWVIALLLSVLRLAVAFTCVPATPTLVDVYKDLAHVYMGYLLCSYRRYRLLFWSMCALEVTVAVFSRL
jgi:hypothetical protein